MVYVDQIEAISATVAAGLTMTGTFLSAWKMRRYISRTPSENILSDIAERAARNQRTSRRRQSIPQ